MDKELLQKIRERQRQERVLLGTLNPDDSLPKFKPVKGPMPDHINHAVIESKIPKSQEEMDRIFLEKLKRLKREGAHMISPEMQFFNDIDDPDKLDDYFPMERIYVTKEHRIIRDCT